MNFAVIGVAGFVSPRHLKAIRDTGHRIVAAVDPNDSVGIIDQFGFDIRFFKEIERFDRHLDKLRRKGPNECVHYVTICSPNYLHDAHVRLALRNGADALCEKPLVISPWNLDGLEALERETGHTVYTVLQLRVHPALIALKERLDAAPSVRHSVDLSYVTSRGPWYDISWKGSPEHSGGVATNIGIHFFDLLQWLFGDVRRSEVHMRQSRRCSGVVELTRADARWFLSVEAADLSFVPDRGAKTTHRSIRIDGEEIEFSEGFTDLHTRVYERTLGGEGFRITDARPSIELVHRINTEPTVASPSTAHPWVDKLRRRA
jgi:UDP-N-acetyl-2-amino-2-deoxyglucuronate dehydrogenase